MNTATPVYRAAVTLAIAAPLFLLWSVLAMGVLAEEGHPADHLYVGVLGVVVGGAVVARLRAPDMVRTMVATAVAQSLVTAIALLNGMHRSPVSSVGEILGVNAMFVALFLGSAWLFHKAAHPSDETAPGRGEAALGHHGG